ncbi:unnamed protein product [Paramecium pentaurelia]|uniref:Uncharacterized protein n=1 Tax=Paramecium pentaurelia TaxID=43138 RepID=A0A8S1SHR7_9CILI|nr:unnamed protein product [Paramecium pentaurelia]
MFQKLFQQVSQIQIEGQPDTAKFSISANEKSIVIWLQQNGNRFFTIDRLKDNWKSREQEFSIPGLVQPSKIHLNENGKILIMYDVTKRYLYTWLRVHNNQNWLLRSILDLKVQINATSEINCFFYKNQIFLDYQHTFLIIKRVNQNFKIVNKKIFKYNDYMNCLTYGYEKDVLAEVTDSTVYFWREDPKTWVKEKSAFYDCEIMPHYSSFQENEVKAFVNGAVWMISYPERECYGYVDDKITKRITQSALNYFFQLDSPIQNVEQFIHFWYRENQQQMKFNYEKLDLSATNILLGRNGNVFVAIKLFGQFINLQIYESLQISKQLQQDI